MNDLEMIKELGEQNEGLKMKIRETKKTIREWEDTLKRNQKIINMIKLKNYNKKYKKQKKEERLNKDEQTNNR